jgi:predicted amidohydrolase
MDKSTIAVAQIDPRLGNVEANLALYETRAAEARGAGADLVVFPELSLTGYLLKDMVPNVALRLDAPEISKLREMSRGMALLAGFVEETPEFRFYNSAAYFEDGELLHVHRKVYLPTYGLFDEGRYFARGDRIRAFDTRLGRMAVLVCEDLWHPSTVYIATLDRALTVLCPSASPIRGISDDAPQDDNARYWESLNRMYAQAFAVSLVHVNRVGFEDGIGFWGGSEIFDASGASVAKAPYYEEAVVTGEISHQVARRQRIVAPMLRDEDIDLTINELTRLCGRNSSADNGEAGER